MNQLEVQVSRCWVNNNMYNVLPYEDFSKQIEYMSDVALVEEYKGRNVVFPYRGEYTKQPINPGIYSAGCVDFIIYPDDSNIDQYTPETIITMSNKDQLKEILEKKEIVSRLDEPWITSPDNITQINVSENDKSEMKCVKNAINAKQIDLDKYAPRFGDNYPNDKRQLKNTTITLNIIKRICKCLDMDAYLTLKDKNPDVANPMNCEISVCLTDDSSDGETD